MKSTEFSTFYCLFAISLIWYYLIIFQPYEWREIHVPGRPEDYGTNSLSSRATTTNGDSGLGTEDDGVFLLPNHQHPHRHLNDHSLTSSNNGYHHHHPHHHPPHHSHSFSAQPRKPGLGTTRSLSQPASDHSHDSSQQSCSSLPNLYLKPGSDILVFRPTSATSCESSPSTMDDNCTTTSGSYSIHMDDPPGSRSLRHHLDTSRGKNNFQHDYRQVQDVYVWHQWKTSYV